MSVRDKTEGIRSSKPRPIQRPATGPQLNKRVHKLQDKHNAANLVNVTARTADGAPRGAPGTDGLGQRMQQTGDSNDVPVRMFHRDPYDDVFALKRDLIRKGQGIEPATPFGSAQMTADDMEYLTRKKDQLQAAKFEQFVASMYNKNDPAQRELLRKVYPELQAKQEDTIRMRAELEMRLAMIKLNGGPRDRGDLMLLWALASGAITPPKGALWDPSTWKDYQDRRNPTNVVNPIARGLFSPTKLRTAGALDAGKIPYDELMAALPAGANATAQSTFDGTQAIWGAPS